ncbi:PepSY domain-containing protein [Methanobrevibacter smithii]|uniref:PepSY domain-containing protein n=1 Tax=Methanobrevibacter smithii TaxID=2173 RepID=UPI0037DD6416
MDKSNIIISIIIVICIAAGVAAYGITNSENPIFSNLNSLDSGSGDSGNGIGNNTTHHDSPSTSSHGSGVSSSSGSGSGSGGGSHHTPYTPHHPSSPKITSEQAKEIANQHIEQSGWYAGTPTLSADRTVWYVPIYDQSGNTVDSMEINANTGVLIGKG